MLHLSNFAIAVSHYNNRDTKLALLDAAPILAQVLAAAAADAAPAGAAAAQADAALAAHAAPADASAAAAD